MPEVPPITDVGLKILYLLLPGIVAFFLIKSVGPKRPRTDFESGLQIFLYGIASYATAGFLEGFQAWRIAPNGTPFWDLVGDNTLGLATLNPTTGLGTGQIAFATLVAIIIGLVVAVLQTYSLPHTILRKLAITKRTGEIDKWGYAFNSPSLDEWVTVRHPNGKVYQGWVLGYSDDSSSSIRELILAEVTVFLAATADANKLEAVDSVPVLYLGLDRDNSIIEFRLAQKSKKGRSVQCLCYIWSLIGRIRLLICCKPTSQGRSAKNGQ